MKRLAVAALTVAGVLAYREWRKAEETRGIWAQATDTV
ncbi:DLW-39 family protein [Nesterenkonia cremea]|nr:DLW-39 family protein [Nesterenkonia cremea]